MALIGAVEGRWTLLNNELLLQWFNRSRLGGRPFEGVGIGTSDCTVGLYMTGTADQIALIVSEAFLALLCTPDVFVIS